MVSTPATESGIQIITLAAFKNKFLAIFLVTYLAEMPLSIWKVLLDVSMVDLGSTFLVTFFEFWFDMGHILRDPVCLSAGTLAIVFFV